MYSKTTGDLLKTLLSTDEYSQFQALKGNSVVSLAEHLETLLNQKRTSKAEVIYRAKLDTVYGYQIFNGTRKPSRDKLLQLAFGFPLTYKETLTLLRIAGVGSLYVRRRRDSIIIFALNKRFSMEQLNPHKASRTEDRTRFLSNTRRYLPLHLYVCIHAHSHSLLCVW